MLSLEANVFWNFSNIFMPYGSSFSKSAERFENSRLICSDIDFSSKTLRSFVHVIHETHILTYIHLSSSSRLLREDKRVSAEVVLTWETSREIGRASCRERV